MADVREQILSRLVTIAGSVDIVDEVFRNTFNLPDTSTKKIVIIDGDEQSSEADPMRRPANSPRLVDMSPEIYLIDSDKPESVGSDSNTFRAAFLKAAFFDDELIALTANKEGMRYDGLVSGLSMAQRGVEYAMGINISFTYLFNPADL